MIEWSIKITSNNCPFTIYIHESLGVIIGVECDHPENPTRYCSEKTCPIKEEQKKCHIKG